MKFQLNVLKQIRPVFFWVLIVLSSHSSAQTSGWEISTGLQSYYLPAPGFHLQSLQPVLQAGRTVALHSASPLGFTVRVGYSRNRYQGDAVYIQSLIGYHPMLGAHLQGGISLGVGYQRSFYSGSSFEWNGEEWVKGKSSHTVWQVPVQFRLGYRSAGSHGAWTPFLAYQAHAQFKYSPDLTPLPVSNFLIGVQFAPNKPE